MITPDQILAAIGHSSLQTAQAIQTMLAPAVMISACGLMLLGMQNRYGRINDRLRSLVRERLELLPERGHPLADAHLAAIDYQMPDLLLRLKRQRDAVYRLFLAVGAFTADTLMIAIGLFLAPALGNLLALIVFIVGMLLVVWASILGASEIGISARAVIYEVQEALKR